jgi:hypothetical protein
MPPKKHKAYAGVSSMDTLKRRLYKSAVYAHLGAITRSGNEPSRITAFKGLRKSPYELLTQVYAGARMGDMFPLRLISILTMDSPSLHGIPIYLDL